MVLDDYFNAGYFYLVIDVKTMVLDGYFNAGYF